MLIGARFCSALRVRSVQPVYLHSAVQSGQHMLVFGGNSGKESNELYAYDLITTAWTKWASGPTFHSSAYPAPRYGHASTVYGPNGGQLLIVGGCKSNNTYYRDSYSMDLATRKWRKMEDLPLDLAYHSLLTWQDRAYLFGSCRACMRLSGLRFSSAALLTAISLLPCAHMTGGFNGKSYVQHLYVLDGMTGKWNVVAVTGQAPPPMCGAATVIKGNELFVFGQLSAEAMQSGACPHTLDDSIAHLSLCFACRFYLQAATLSTVTPTSSIV